MATRDVEAALARPSEEVGQALIGLMEDQWFDRKSATIKEAKLADCEVAFANAEGGTIAVGLREGVVEGTDRWAKHRNALIQASMDLTRPAVRVESRLIECVRDDGTPDHLLLLQVEASELVHLTINDVAMLRVGDESRRLSFRQRQELTFDKGQSQFDATVMKELELHDLDQDAIAAYAEVIGHPAHERVLFARSLVSRQGGITAAALLLFGSDPQFEFPEAYVRVLRFRGLARGSGSRQNLVEDVRCEGPIPHVIRQARDVVRRVQPARRVLGRDGLFESEALIPEDAWLEGLVNAVVHRSYSLTGDHIRIDVFDDRIEVESPGRFPGLVRLEDAKAIIRFARNPRIARVCADLSFGEELGEGIRRIYDEMRVAGLAEPVYGQTPASVRLVLSGTIRLAPELAATLPRETRMILEAIREASQASTGDIAEAILLSKPSTLKRLHQLQDAGLIEWVGKSARDPRAYWQLKTE